MSPPKAGSAVDYAILKKGSFWKMDAAFLFVALNPAFAGDSESAILII